MEGEGDGRGKMPRLRIRAPLGEAPLPAPRFNRTGLTTTESSRELRSAPQSSTTELGSEPRTAPKNTTWGSAPRSPQHSAGFSTTDRENRLRAEPAPPTNLSTAESATRSQMRRRGHKPQLPRALTYLWNLTSKIKLTDQPNKTRCREAWNSVTCLEVGLQGDEKR